MAKTFKFTIKIDDDSNSLSPENGLPFNKLGELLVNLYKAIDTDMSNVKCTLTNIVDGSYGATLLTDSELLHNNLEVVHKNLETIPVDELPENQREYGYSLKRILGGQYHLKAENNEGKEVAVIKTLEKQTPIDAYYSTETVYGILSQIGSQHVNASKKWIYLDGIHYRISVTREQDAELKEYYTTHKLSVRVRLKHSVSDGHVMSAELISFTVLEQTDIIDTLKEIGYVDFELIKDAHTVDDIVNRIYGAD